MGNTAWGCVDPETQQYHEALEEEKVKLRTLADENQNLKNKLQDQDYAIQQQKEKISHMAQQPNKSKQSDSDSDGKFQRLSMENIRLKQQLSKQKAAIQRQLESQKNQITQFNLSKQESQGMFDENDKLKKDVAAQELTIGKMQQELDAMELLIEQQQQEKQQQEDSKDEEEDSKEEKEKKESYAGTHEQPFADATPSIAAFEHFSDSQANKAANTVAAALANKADRNDTIITVTVSYSQAQRMQIAEAYNKKTDKKNKPCNLVKDLKKILSGSFKKVVVGLWQPTGLYDAIQVDDGVEGLGFKTELLNEIICTRTAIQIAAMRNAWYKGIPLLDRIRKDTSKGKVGNYAKLLCSLLEGKRPANGSVDVRAAHSDANVLNGLLKGKKDSDTKAKFVEIFTTRSWTQIREISKIFPDVSLKWTLNHAIKDKFGGGDTGKAMMIIESFACKPYDFFANLLIVSMRGAGTNNDLLQRVIISRADVDLQNVTGVFNQSHGDGLTLNQWFEDESAVSGDYKKLLLAICGYGLPQKK